MSSSGPRRSSRLLAALLSVALGTGLLAASAGAASFVPAPGTPLPVGAQPYSVLAQDLNGDGRGDVAAMNGTSSNLSVFLGDGAAGFAAASGSPFATGSGPSGVAVADFNGDGRQDLAVSNYGSESVTVLLAQPGGGWAPEAGGVSAPGAGAIAVADFNGDGRPDLAVPNYNAGGVYVFLRQVAGGFQLEGSSPTGVNPRAVAVADFNGDGLQDLAVTNFGSDTVSVLLRQPLGGFATEGSPLAVGAKPAGIVARDLDGDGTPDLAVANYGSGSLSVLLRRPGGFVADPASPLATGAGTTGVAAADFDGDGRADLAATNNGAGTLSVLLRTGPGYTPVAESPFALPAGPSGVAAGDLDGDRRPDLVVASDQANVLNVLLNRIVVATGPPVPIVAKPAGREPLRGVSAKSISVLGGGDKLSAELKKALAKVDLNARLESAAASSQITTTNSNLSAKPDPALEERLRSFIYGIPVTIKASPGQVVELTAAMALKVATSSGSKVVVVQLPTVAGDLQAAISEMRVIVDRKAALELQIKGVEEAGIAVSAEVDDLKNQLDSLGELSETDSLRMQMALDRYSKNMTILSNLTKKLGETSATIVTNIKRPATDPAQAKKAIQRRAAVVAAKASKLGNEAAKLLAPAARADHKAPPRATVAIKPCGRRCPYPSFTR